jgi:hypothetical protein
MFRHNCVVYSGANKTYVPVLWTDEPDTLRRFIHWQVKFTSNHTCSDNGTQSNSSTVAYLGMTKPQHFTHIISTRIYFSETKDVIDVFLSIFLEICVWFIPVRINHMYHYHQLTNQIHDTWSSTSNVVYLGMNKPQQCSQITSTRIDYYRTKEVIDPLHPYFQT